MYDDARLAAALASGLVENDTFRLSRTAWINRDTVIRNCIFLGREPMTMLDTTGADIRVELTGCVVNIEPADEMTSLYDLLEESHGRSEA